MQIIKGKFFNPSRGEMTLQDVLEEIVSWMSEDANCRYEIIIATDSASDMFPRFPAVVTVRKFLGSSGKGGRFFVERVSFGEKAFHTFRDRIWEEAHCSVDLANLAREGLKKLITEKGLPLRYTIGDIHLDIGDNGPTRAMVAEICGFVTAHGFNPIIKPEAWAARIADRYS